MVLCRKPTCNQNRKPKVLTCAGLFCSCNFNLKGYHFTMKTKQKVKENCPKCSKCNASRSVCCWNCGNALLEFEPTTTQRLYEAKKYSKTWAYLCRLFGVHYIYFGRWWLFFLYILTCGGFRIWAIVDLFRIPGMVETANLELQYKYWLGE